MAAKITTPAITAASINFTRATSELTQAFNNLQSLVTTAEDLDAQIAAKNAEIVALDLEFANKLRQAEVELNIATRENVKSVVYAYLSNNNLEALDTNEVTRLKSAEKTTFQQGEVDKKAALVQQEKTLKAEFNASTDVLKAQQAAVLAEANANNKSLQDKVNFLQEQVQALLTQLSEQRQAEIDKVKAANPQQVITNVTEVAKK